MEIKLSGILDKFSQSGLLESQTGPDHPISRIVGVESSGAGDLVFVESKDFVAMAIEKQPSGIVTSKELAASFADCKNTGLLISGNVRLAHSLIKQEFFDRDFCDEQWEQQHPSAVIHETAKVEVSAVVGPNVVIGKEANIGANCRLMAGVIIENGASIDSGTTLHPNVVIGYNCKVGKDCLLGPGTIIGSEGFGFAQDKKRKAHRLPHTGSVVIEDNVRMGANNCVDRGTYGETRIGAGTKTDNLCHFAHNVQIGEDCLLTAAFCVAGSTKIGDRVMASGQTGILDHLNVSADTIFVHRAGVTQDITEPGMYAGLPAQPIRDYKRNTAMSLKLTEISKRLRELEEKLKS